MKMREGPATRMSGEDEDAAPLACKHKKGHVTGRHQHPLAATSPSITTSLTITPRVTRHPPRVQTKGTRKREGSRRPADAILPPPLSNRVRGVIQPHHPLACCRHPTTIAGSQT